MGQRESAHKGASSRGNLSRQDDDDDDVVDGGEKRPKKEDRNERGKGGREGAHEGSGNLVNSPAPSTIVANQFPD